MTYDFNQSIDRRDTDCVKYDLLQSLYGRTDITPMWVADMDFAAPQCVIDAITERCQHPVLGYAVQPKGYTEAVTHWLYSHYGINAQPNQLHFMPGIVAGISFALLALTNPSDRILVTTPVYPPFLNLPTGCGRTVVKSRLKITDGRFAIDLDDFERQARGCKMLILANPHNPAGTIWCEADLQRIADICHRNGIIVVSDEIHADLTLENRRHHSYSTVSALAAAHSITFTAPSKTFNIAGLSSSVCYVANNDLRQRFFGWLDALGVAQGSIFAYVGAQAAYAHGEPWLQQLKVHLASNRDLLKHTAASILPRLKVILPEASYLAWLDFSDYNLPHSTTSQKLINEAHVALNDGTTFGGKEYENCFRMNIGCPQPTLSDALQRIATAFENIS
ncbi:MAG: PatB family C-S lyase [Bacteroidales bacterium]|nr:PatB family C-S lyase [Bacteroidales bacterium]